MFVVVVAMSVSLCCDLIKTSFWHPKKQTRKQKTKCFIFCMKITYTVICMKVDANMQVVIAATRTKEGRECFIYQRSQHILFMVIWRRIYDKRG